MFALCVVLPMAFHSIQNAGAIFCPMHIPVLLCGLLVGWPYGSAVRPGRSAVIQPADRYACDGLSALHDGGALARMACFCGLFMKFVRTGKIYADLYISLVCGLLIGR